jgi:erythromycin esterase-like protein
MLKKALLVTGLFVVLQIKSLLGQTNNHDLQSIKSIEFASINAQDENYQDLAFLKEMLKDKRIVLLGEQSHGEGSTFAAKARLVKFLHQEMDFDIISFESGLYDIHKTFKEVNTENFNESPLKESIYKIWSETNKFEPLLKYFHQQSKGNNPLLVTGFDAQADQIFEEQFLTDLLATLNGRLKLNEAEFNLLQEVVAAGPEFIVSDREDSTQFYTTCAKIKTSLENLPDLKSNVDAKVLLQTFNGWLEMLRWQIDLMNDVSVIAQNPRDIQMAKNLIFLSELYPDKKIIGWGGILSLCQSHRTVSSYRFNKTVCKKIRQFAKK